MKRFPFAVAAALLLPLSAAQAGPDPAATHTVEAVQRRPDLPNNTLTVNPVSFMLGGLEPTRLQDKGHLLDQNLGLYSLEYERVLHDSLSLYVAPAYLHFARYGGVLATGYGGALGLRHFFLGNAPGGLWAGAEFHANTFSGSFLDSVRNETVFNSFSFGVGAMAGYTVLVANTLDISLGVGAGANYTIETNSYSGPWFKIPYSVNTESVDLVLLLRLNVGFAF